MSSFSSSFATYLASLIFSLIWYRLLKLWVPATKFNWNICLLRCNKYKLVIKPQASTAVRALSTMYTWVWPSPESAIQYHISRISLASTLHRMVLNSRDAKLLKTKSSMLVRLVSNLSIDWTNISSLAHLEELSVCWRKTKDTSIISLCCSSPVRNGKGSAVDTATFTGY